MDTFSSPRPADYDSFAWFYHHHWSKNFLPCATAVIRQLLLPALPPGARILDVCCGSGELAAELSGSGYRVTGIDSSYRMLRFARDSSVGSLFFCADARQFRMQPVFSAAVCMFDSINHILSASDLLQVFRSVRVCLAPGGLFLFDILLEDAYLRDWSQSGVIVADDYACFIRGGYDREAGLGRTEVTLFRKSDAWERSDTSFFERYYPPAQLLQLLDEAGFSNLQFWRVDEDLGIADNLGRSRVVFLAHNIGAE